jgi:hypothetical protein
VNADSKLYLCSGEESYDALQQVLEEMVATGSLKKSVDVSLSSSSEDTEQLEIVWHLYMCSD